MTQQTFRKHIFLCFSQHTNSISPLFDETTRELEMDDTLKVDILNNYFCGQSCIDEDGKDLPACAVYPDNFPTLSRIVVTTSDVDDAIKCLKIGKASGPDGIDNRVLRESVHQISTVLRDLFNSCLQYHTMPKAWKLANVSAVLKRVTPHSRPITDLSHF